MDVVNSNEDRLHVVMLPWLAMGHLIPFLELSNNLAQRGIRISYISSPRNIERVKSRIPTKLSPLINLIKFPLPPVQNLPPNAEATIDLPIAKGHYLQKAFDGLETPFANFLKRSSPNWIIYDFSAHWLPPLAAQHSVPCAYLSLYSAAAAAFFGPPSMLLGGSQQAWDSSADGSIVFPKWLPSPPQVFLRRFELERITNAMEEVNDQDLSSGYRLGKAMGGSDVVLIRTYREFEPDMLDFVEKEITQKPTIPSGTFVPSVHQEGLILLGDEAHDQWVGISEWLNKQKRESVVYVALGSEASLNQEEMDELALGLELSELPFFWVLRNPPPTTGSSPKVELPNGFKERTSGRGVVWEGWAPQVKILRHSCVGGFLTHCGWNSIVEGLGFGRALILFPCIWEQGMNARLMESKKIGLEIVRDERDGSFTRESVAKTLRTVMVELEGEPIRTKAREMKEIFGNKNLHDGYMDNLVRYMKVYNKRKEEEISKIDT